MTKVASTMALTALLTACWTDSGRAQGGAFPQPMTPAAYCPDCNHGPPPGYGPAVPPPGLHQPPPPWAGGYHVPEPEVFSGYTKPDDRISGWYFGGITGAVFLDNQRSDAIDENIRREIRTTFDWEATGGAMVGYRFPHLPRDLGQLRFEFETMFRQNDVKTLKFNGVEIDNTNGQVFANSFMFNAFVDLVPVSDWLVPYIGGGVGVVRVQQDLAYGTADFNDSDAAFGFQGMAGASVRLWENVEVFSEFRYMGVSNPKLLHIDRQLQPERVRLRSQYDTYQILGGVRVTLY